MDAAHRATDREIKKIQRHLGGIYAEAKKSAEKVLKDWAASVEDHASNLLEAVQNAESETEKRTAKNAYLQFYQKSIKEKAFLKVLAAIQAKMYAANTQAAQYINRRTAAVYAKNYNAMGKSLDSALDGYEFKPIEESDAEEYGDVSKQTVDRRKDNAWNKQNIASAVVAGALMLWGAQKIAKTAAASTAQKNRGGANRQASDMLTDAESKGRLDSMWRCYDEGFDGLQKEWVCVFDNKTRDTHIEYNDLGPVALDYEYAPGLARPRDPNCSDAAEVCNCRCELVFNTGLASSGTRTAREGDVHGRAHDYSSYSGTETVTVEQMTYREWMQWRSR